jgi:regulator of protease activity HflC (stomatin/prohibitin superfamily)
MNVPSAVKWVLVAVLILFAVTSLAPFVLIGAGERGVVLRLGAVEDRIMDEGFHFRIPLVENVVKVDVKTQKTEVDAPSFSKDLQNVDTRIALNFHVDPKHANKLWQEIGRDYESRIIAPSIQESVKATTAQFTAAELVAERPRVKDEIKRMLEERLGPRYVVVDDFSIVNFAFSDSFEKAIEEKQVAQQNALKAENDLKRIQVEAEQRIAQAKAEAEAIKIQTEALQQNQNLIRLEAVKRWNGVLPQYVMGNTIPFVDVTAKP